MKAYYNEIDPYCAEWLRNLIKAGEIPAGDVDERDIKDVTPAELVEYTQCHFFAGTGGWSYALRLAGWPDDRPVWTGSCPCQSFSAAGRGQGFADERHLWPYWFHLIRVCRPPIIFGEQVASNLALSWLDLVFDDLEAEGYSCGAADLPACSVGAPHIRQRLWFVAKSYARRCGAQGKWGGLSGEIFGEGTDQPLSAEKSSPIGLLADTLECPGNGSKPQPIIGSVSEEDAGVRAMADPGLSGHSPRGAGNVAAENRENDFGGAAGINGRNGGASNFWSSAIWLPCRDGKWRPTKPGIQPLAHGIPARVGKLRAAGNAICPEIGAEFIKVFL